MQSQDHNKRSTGKGRPVLIPTISRNLAPIAPALVPRAPATTTIAVYAGHQQSTQISAIPHPSASQYPIAGNTQPPRLSSDLVLTNQKLRRGKWTASEEAYTVLLIDCFDKGIADCENGMTLRTYLSRKLHCSPMRISKKYAGKGIGKKVFLSRLHGDSGGTQCSSTILQAIARLQAAEELFLSSSFPNAAAAAAAPMVKCAFTAPLVMMLFYNEKNDHASSPGSHTLSFHFHSFPQTSPQFAPGLGNNAAVIHIAPAPMTVASVELAPIAPAAPTPVDSAQPVLLQPVAPAPYSSSRPHATWNGFGNAHSAMLAGNSQPSVPEQGLSFVTGNATIASHTSIVPNAALPPADIPMTTSACFDYSLVKEGPASRNTLNTQTSVESASSAQMSATFTGKKHAASLHSSYTRALREVKDRKTSKPTGQKHIDAIALTGEAFGDIALKDGIGPRSITIANDPKAWKVRLPVCEQVAKASKEATRPLSRCETSAGKAHGTGCKTAQSAETEPVAVGGHKLDCTFHHHSSDGISDTLTTTANLIVAAGISASAFVSRGQGHDARNTLEGTTKDTIEVTTGLWTNAPGRKPSIGELPDLLVGFDNYKVSCTRSLTNFSQESYAHLQAVEYQHSPTLQTSRSFDEFHRLLCHEDLTSLNETMISPPELSPHAQVLQNGMDHSPITASWIQSHRDIQEIAGELEHTAAGAYATFAQQPAPVAYEGTTHMIHADGIDPSSDQNCYSDLSGVLKQPGTNKPNGKSVGQGGVKRKLDSLDSLGQRVSENTSRHFGCGHVISESSNNSDDGSAKESVTLSCDDGTIFS